MSYRWIKASEVVDYMYCRRAWWLQRTAELPSENVHELEAGSHYHQEHGRLVRRAVWARRLAYTLLFIVVAVIAFRIFMGL